MTEGLPLVRFSVTDSEIATLGDTYKGANANTKDGYRMVMSGLAACRKIRVGVEKRKKELKRDALEWGRTVDAEVRRINGLVHEIEGPLKLTRAEADDRELAEILAKKESERKERESAEEAARIERDKIEQVARDKREAEHAARMAEERAKLEAERAAAAIEADKARAKAESEAKVIAAQLEERRKKVEVEEDRVKAFEAKAAAEIEEAREKLRVIQAAEMKLEIERKRIENEKRVRERLAEEENDRVREAERTKENLLLFEKDVEALRCYAKAMESEMTSVPEVIHSDKAVNLFDTAHDEVVAAAEKIWEAIHYHKEAVKGLCVADLDLIVSDSAMKPNKTPVFSAREMKKITGVGFCRGT